MISVLYDTKGHNFAIDMETRQIVTLVPLAGTSFVYTQMDSSNTHGELQAPGPTELEITLYVRFLLLLFLVIENNVRT